MYGRVADVFGAVVQERGHVGAAKLSLLYSSETVGSGEAAFLSVGAAVMDM